MFILVNGVLFDRLGYCTKIKLHVDNAEKINYTDMNPMLVDKHLAHERLVEMAFNKLNSQSDEAKTYPVVTQLASHIIPELYNGENEDIPVQIFNCDENDPEGVNEIVKSLVQYDQIPIIILGMSNEEMDNVAVNDTIMMLLSLDSEAINRTAIATVEIIPYDIPEMFSATRDKNFWGMIFPIVMMNPITCEVSPINNQYVAYNIYELIKKQ